MKITIRKAKLNDLRKCSVLLNGFKELSNPSGEPNHLWWLRDLIKKQVFIVAEIRGEIIGLAIGEVATGNLGFLHLICVKKEFQNKGIGNLLYKEREKMLRKKGVRAIIAYVSPKNKKALNILKKNKFDRGQLMYEHIKFLR